MSSKCKLSADNFTGSIKGQFSLFLSLSTLNPILSSPLENPRRYRLLPLLFHLRHYRSGPPPSSTGTRRADAVAVIAVYRANPARYRSRYRPSLRRTRPVVKLDFRPLFSQTSSEFSSPFWYKILPSTLSHYFIILMFELLVGLRYLGFKNWGFLLNDELVEIGA